MMPIGSGSPWTTGASRLGSLQNQTEIQIPHNKLPYRNRHNIKNRFGNSKTGGASRQQSASPRSLLSGYKE